MNNRRVITLEGLLHVENGYVCVCKSDFIEPKCGRIRGHFWRDSAIACSLTFNIIAESVVNGEKRTRIAPQPLDYHKYIVGIRGYLQ